jgi:two-component system OmpR family sensor kinase
MTVVPRHEPGLELDEILAMLSHELRTPLSTIAGYLEIISEELEGRIEPRYQLILEAGRRNVTRMTRLLDDLLTVSRDGLLVPGTEEIDLCRVLREVVEDLTVPAVGRSVDLVLAVPEEPLVVTGDGGQLYRACVNLVGNALKFSHEGGRVAIGVAREGTDTVLRVADDGIGIPADARDQLGTSFFRSSNAIERQITGTGLGLRIVQLVADAHDGIVEIDSEEGRGTTVTLRLRGTASDPSTITSDD